MTTLERPTTILRLPDETIADILLYALPNESHPVINEVPLNVSSSNRALRTIAINCPLLWSHLYMDLRSTSEAKPGWKNLLDLWIRRSGNTKLSCKLRFILAFLSSRRQRETFQEMITLLMRKQSQLRALSFINLPNVVAKDIPELQIEYILDNMPSLNGLKIVQGYRTKELAIYLSDTAQLQDLYLKEIPSCIWQTISPTVSGQQLISLVLELDDSLESNLLDCISCLNLLKDCVMIKRLSLSMRDAYGDSGLPSQLTEMPLLTLDQLEYMNFDNGANRCLIGKLTAPHLKHLIVNMDRSSLFSLHEFLLRSNPPIEVLEIQGNNGRDDRENVFNMYRSIFKCLPGLVTLQISDALLPIQFWPILSIHDGSGDALLPGLKKLSIGQADHFNWDIDDLVNMLISRWKYDGKFEASLFRACTTVAFKLSNHTLLQVCRSHGFRFKIEEPVISERYSSEEEEEEEEEEEYDEYDFTFGYDTEDIELEIESGGSDAYPTFEDYLQGGDIPDTISGQISDDDDSDYGSEENEDYDSEGINN